MSSAPGIAILGAGIFAKEAHLPALAKIAEKSKGHFELKAVYSRSENSATSLASTAKEALSLPAVPDIYFDVAGDGKDTSSSISLEALLRRDDVHGVIVVLPITHQPGVIRSALAAGKHVLSEKPVSKNVAEGVQLISEYRKQYVSKGIVWRVAENFEAETAIRTAAQWIQDGKIGNVQSFDIRVTGYIDEKSKYYNTPWRTVPDYQGGFLLDGGVHFAAALRTLVGPLASVSGHASLSKKILAPHDGISASVLAASGAHGTFCVSFAAPHPNTGSALHSKGYSVVGSKGWVTLGSGKNGGWEASLSTVEGTELKSENLEAQSDGVETEIFHWLAKISGKGDSLAIGEPEYTLADVALIQACLTSQGNAVQLEELTKGTA